MKRNSLAVVFILLLLGIGYFFPMAILAMEDKGLMQEEKTIAIEEIQLNTQNTDIVEQLQIFPDMLFDSVMVEMDRIEQSSSKLEEQEVEKQKDENNLIECINKFWQTVKEGEKLIFEKFLYKNYVMMAGLQSDKVYSIWEVTGVDQAADSFRFWIDDASGKVIAFEIPFSSIGGSDEAYYAAMYCLSNYYGFSSYELTDSIKNLEKIKSWENGFILYDEKNNIKLNLEVYKVGDRLYFNIYPGSKKFS